MGCSFMYEQPIHGTVHAHTRYCTRPYTRPYTRHCGEMYLCIVMTVSLLIMNQTDLRLVDNQKENNHNDHIPLNLKVIS